MFKVFTFRCWAHWATCCNQCTKHTLTYFSSITRRILVITEELLLSTRKTINEEAYACINGPVHPKHSYPIVKFKCALFNVNDWRFNSVETFTLFVQHKLNSVHFQDTAIEAVPWNIVHHVVFRKREICI